MIPEWLEGMPISTAVSPRGPPVPGAQEGVRFQVQVADVEGSTLLKDVLCKRVGPIAEQELMDSNRRQSVTLERQAQLLLRPIQKRAAVRRRTKRFDPVLEVLRTNGGLPISEPLSTRA